MIPAKGRVIVPTDISIAVPPGCYGRVAPRSGLAVKHFLDVGAGVIDEDYRGAVGVVMWVLQCKDDSILLLPVHSNLDAFPLCFSE